MLLTAFIAATLAWTGLSLVLSARQTAHVRRHRDAVPPEFAAHVSLDEHRKAADYTVAREGLARVETLVGTALTLAWVLGGIGLLYRALSGLLAIVPTDPNFTAILPRAIDYAEQRLYRELNPAIARAPEAAPA